MRLQYDLRIRSFYCAFAPETSQEISNHLVIMFIDVEFYLLTAIHVM